MINFILFGSFFILLLLNAPIAVSLGLSSVLAMVFGHDKLSVIPTNVYNGMSKFLLLAIPFFVISGNVMAEAGISKRLVGFIDDCVGHQKGGIAIVCVIVAMFFGAISGSGPATVAALGIILIPAMVNSGGFSAPFASALMAAASSIAIVIPPSIAFVVYASITGVGVGDMFMAGIIPGIMMGLALIVIVWIEVRRRGITATRERSTWKHRGKTFLSAFWASWSRSSSWAASTAAPSPRPRLRPCPWCMRCWSACSSTGRSRSRTSSRSWWTPARPPAPSC